MADIRQRVKEDQGILKKIQMFVPGFRGYRQREDLRDADRMLRDQLAKKLGAQREEIEEARSLVTKSFKSKELELMGKVINQYKKTEGLVSHSSPGYSGISADIQFKQDEISRLYDYDASMIDGLESMQQAIDAIKAALEAEENQQARKSIAQLRALIENFEDQFKRRIDIIQGTEV
ncbi:MAG: hypothetical protein A4E31_01209 [Methanomassiliicoccales archaeon PtaU1.Bin030]|jgi:hypothetical protein|nr:MAG: hypothetical protein A4E31_01209 [Methanomassiliicoccales archaeon PtaU1.Bin030]